MIVMRKKSRPLQEETEDLSPYAVVAVYKNGSLLKQRSKIIPQGALIAISNEQQGSGFFMFKVSWNKDKETTYSSWISYDSKKDAQDEGWSV